MNLVHGLYTFKMPGASNTTGFVRVDRGVLNQVELDYYLPAAAVVALIKQTFEIELVLASVQIRVSRIIWEFNRKLNTINRVHTKPVVYKILQSKKV